jgi:purine-binding chemotaxis protein CheW
VTATVRSSLPTTDVAPPPEVAQIVTFRVGDDLFAADVHLVERVLRYSEPTPVPNMPVWVAGVLEYQKRAVPVIDLRLRFGATAHGKTSDMRILVFNTAGGWIAAVVDAVLEVAVAERGRIEPAPPLFRGFSAEYLHGIVKRDGQLVLLLAADRILSATELTLVTQMDQKPATAPPRRSRG